MKSITPIKVTKRQAARLIEMCEALLRFENDAPGLTKFGFDPTGIKYEHTIGMVTIYTMPQWGQIHWLELCQTYLRRALADKTEEVNDSPAAEKAREDDPDDLAPWPDEVDPGDLIGLYEWQNDHPIDQLYTQFKAIKPFLNKLNEHKTKTN